MRRHQPEPPVFRLTTEKGQLCDSLQTISLRFLSLRLRSWGCRSKRTFSPSNIFRACAAAWQQRPNNLRDLLNTLALIAPLLNAIPNVVFFIKDAQARYLLANLTLARRCGFKTVTPLLGKTSADVFPPSSDPATPSRICGYCATAC